MCLFNPIALPFIIQKPKCRLISPPPPMNEQGNRLLKPSFWPLVGQFSGLSPFFSFFSMLLRIRWGSVISQVCTRPLSFPPLFSRVGRGVELRLPPQRSPKVLSGAFLECNNCGKAKRILGRQSWQVFLWKLFVPFFGKESVFFGKRQVFSPHRSREIFENFHIFVNFFLSVKIHFVEMPPPKTHRKSAK